MVNLHEKLEETTDSDNVSTPNRNFRDPNDWNSVEEAILKHLLLRYSGEFSGVTLYAKIAYHLDQKSIRDVAVRCKILGLIKRRRIENLNPIPLNFVVEDEISSGVLRQNEDMNNQISANLASNKGSLLMANHGEKLQESTTTDRNYASTPFFSTINRFSNETTPQNFADSNEWTPEQQTVLENLFRRYSWEFCGITLYAKIAYHFNRKSIRDVVRRCKMLGLIKRRRRIEDPNPIPTNFVVQNKISSGLLKQNVDMSKQIFANFASHKLEDNIAFFSKIHENLMKLKKKENDDDINLNLKMPPLMPVKLKQLPPQPILLPSTQVNNNFSNEKEDRKRKIDDLEDSNNVYNP